MISLKRSRDSSSCLLAGSDHANLLQSPEKRQIQCAGRYQVNFAVCSPEEDKESDRGQTDSFFDQCGFCKRKLGQNDPLFMYGYLGAFCSPGCRGKQISYDKIVELSKRIQSKRGRISADTKKNDSEDKETAGKQVKSYCSSPPCKIYQKS